MIGPVSEASHRSPVIAIVGRPNAGKSTLFNRLTHSRRALVHAEPGVTRDRNIAAVEVDGRRFTLVDTGGLEASGGAEEIDSEVRLQSQQAIEEADAVILLVDGRAGVSPADADVLARLRQSRKPFWVAVNKLDTPGLDDDAADFFALGVDRVVAISAAHGRGVGDLLEEVLEGLPATAEPEVAEEPAGGAAGEAISVAIVGRPNVGKSSLANRLLGFERSIVTPLPGTTRDAIDTPFTHDGQAYVLVDTAGMRRRPRLQESLEKASVARALRALERCEVAVLVVSAADGMADQDARIASYAWERGRGLVVVVNKSDLAEGVRRAAARLESEVRHQYRSLEDVPILFVSAVTGEGLAKVLPTVARVARNHRRQVQTSKLNQVINAATRGTMPPSVRGKRPTFQYAVQTSVRPPTFALFCSAPSLVPVAYTRYLQHCLRSSFEFSGTPLRISYRARHEAPRTERARRPSADKRRRRGR